MPVEAWGGDKDKQRFESSTSSGGLWMDNVHMPFFNSQLSLHMSYASHYDSLRYCTQFDFPNLIPYLQMVHLDSYLFG